MSPKKPGQASRNLTIYELDGVVREYAEPPASLHIGEKAVLERIAEEITDVRILDIGVGGGRTTPNLIQFSRDYIGIDYSGAMIAACKSKYPETVFFQCDAREMESNLEGSFGFIFFSFNGIDCVNHRERQEILEQTFSLLEPGGLFFFCSHNMNVTPDKPWSRKLYKWDNLSLTFAKNIYGIATNILNYLRNFSAQSKEQNHAMWVDIGHEFRTLHYYVQPRDQIRVLQKKGFRDIRVFDGGGQLRSPSEPSLQRTAHVYYLARKPV